MISLHHILLLASASLTLATPLVSTNPVDDDSLRITPCATVRCAAGYRCVATGKIAKCVPFLEVPDKSMLCGSSVCGEGLECCNSSCGICVKPGMMCTQQFCEKEEPVFPAPTTTSIVPMPTVTKTPGLGSKCGDKKCASNQVCCNSSCGICTPPGGACIALYCGKLDSEPVVAEEYRPVA